MRTSHKRMQHLINEEISKITDEELFCSPAFAAYLTDSAETVTERYKRKIMVQTGYDTSEGARLAYTDDEKIFINTGNYITNSFPTRVLKADSLMGMNAHEIGHILYTDFSLSSCYFELLEKGRVFTDEPADFSEEEKEALLRPFFIAKECGCRFTFGSDRHTAVNYNRYPKLEKFIDVLGLTEENFISIL